jgi:hypothetical protein
MRLREVSLRVPCLPRLRPAGGRRSFPARLGGLLGSFAPAVAGCWLLPRQLGFFWDPGCCPRGRFISRPLRVRSLRSPDGLAFEDAFGVSLPGFHQAPLMGFSKTAPPSTHAHEVHSCVQPRRLPGWVSRFGPPLPRADPVPSSRFLTALTVYSVVRAAGFLHPAADHGVHRVQVPRSASRPHSVPSTLLDPSKGFPRQQPSALVGFLPSHRSPSKDGAISGPLSAGRVRCFLHVLPRERARSSLGFLLVQRFVASLRGGPSSRRTRGLAKAISARGALVPGNFAEAGFWAGCSPPRNPSVQWTGCRGAISVGRLRPHAGRRGSRVACSRGSELSSSLAGRGVALESWTLSLRRRR